MAFSLEDIQPIAPRTQKADDPEQSFLWKSLEALNRPYSMVMGGVAGILGEGAGPLENMGQAAMGKRNFSALDTAGALGFDTSSPTVQKVALGADILSPLDPLNYLTLGANKVGKVGMGIAKATRGAEKAEFLTRAGAAAAGGWNPINIAGVGLLPKSAAVRAGAAVDKVAERADRFMRTNAIAKHFGGMKRMEESYPDLVRALKDASGAASLDERQFTEEMSKLIEGLRAAGKTEDELENITRDAFDLLETPATRIQRIETELQQLADGTWTRPLLPWDSVDDVEAGAKALADDQAAIAARKAEIENIQAVPVNPEAQGRLLGEQRVLEDVTINPADPAPQDFMLRRAEKLQRDLEIAKSTRGAAAPDSLALADELSHWRDVMQSKYDVIAKYDPNFTMPIEDYMAHMFPRNAAKRRGAVMESGTDAAIKERAAAARAGTVMSDDSLRGKSDAFTRRKYKETAAEARKLRDEGYDFPVWEENAPAVMDVSMRNATRWRLAHDAHEEIVRIGQSVDGDTFRSMDAAERAKYVPMDFNIPWIDPKKNPFRDRYMTKEADALMRRYLGAAYAFTNRGGQSAMMKVMHSIRHQYVNWTLGPFPGTHVRNLASDIVQNFLGGLNPVTDLAAALNGGSSYLTGLALASRAAHVPVLGSDAAFANAGVDNLISYVNSRTGANWTADNLLKEMEKRNILGQQTLRDDVELLGQDRTLALEIGKKEGALKKLGKGLFSPNADKNLLVKGGFALEQRASDFTRSALFAHSLKEALTQTDNLDTALTYAEAAVRKHLFDYSDLTPFERDYMRLIIPFYTFTSKNIPLQIEKSITSPGKQAWINRMFQGMWAQPQQEDFNYEDLPEWLQTNMSVPMRKTKDKDGNEVWSVSTLRGWLPQTELNELADAVRGEKFLGFFAERMNPIFTEFFEQTMNYDSYLGREIDRGQTVEMFGIPMHPRAAHLIRNLRLVNEVDKLNPGDAWTKIWEKYAAKEGSGRPHRREAPQAERFSKQITGLNFYSVDAEKEARRAISDADKAMNKALSSARIAAKFGQIREAENFREQAREYAEAGRMAQRRLNELRRDRAAREARKQL